MLPAVKGPSRARSAAFTCAVAWVGEVLHGDVNHPHIDGKDGVVSAILAGLIGPADSGLNLGAKEAS